MKEISEINTERTFAHGKWIWHNGETGNDEYTEFTDSFDWVGGAATVRISVSGDYTLFINGKYAASNQYGDFEYYKVYDEIDITKFLKAREKHPCRDRLVLGQSRNALEYSRTGNDIRG